MDPLYAASVGDHATILKLIAAYFAYDEIPFDEPSVSDGLKLLLRDPGLGRVFLIRSGPKIAGYLIVTFGFDLELGGRFGTITDLYLCPEYRRQGLGSKALHALFDLCAGLEIKALQLQPERDNTEARALYAKMGFVVADRIPMSKRLTG